MFNNFKKYHFIILLFLFLFGNIQIGFFTNKSYAASFGKYLGFGEKIGTFNVVDPFFSKSGLRISCQDKKYKSYNFDAYYNKNFFYAWDVTGRGFKLLIGYRPIDNNKVFRIEGLNFRKNSTGRIYMRSYFTVLETKGSYYEYVKNGTKINDTSITGKSSRTCILNAHFINNYEKLINPNYKPPIKKKSSIFPVKDLSKQELLENALITLKSFQQAQYKVSNLFSRNDIDLLFKFELNDSILKLSMLIAEEKNKTPKIIVKEDLESKKLAEQRAQELEKERLRLQSLLEEKKRLEAKARQLEKSNRLSEIEAKKRSEELAKEIAAQEREKLAKERELRRIESEARLKAEEKAKKLSQERALAQAKAKKLAEEQKKAEKLARQLELERTILEKENEERLKKLEEQRKQSEQIARKLMKETELAKKKANELEKTQQTQLASLEEEKAKRNRLIQEEKKKREDLQKKFAALQEENKKNNVSNSPSTKIKLPPEWMPYQNKMSLQQDQFCQLTNRFFGSLNKATKSGNEIKVNMVHRDRQENMDGLIPDGRINNWIFKVVKIDQVEDGSAAVVLRLQCKSFVGSGQINTKSTWLKKSNKEWRATIPYQDRRFRELAKLDRGQFILATGTLLEVEAFKPGQIETFYASQQIGEHPLTKGLNLEGELFIADLSYIAALN